TRHTKGRLSPLACRVCTVGSSLASVTLGVALAGGYELDDVGAAWSTGNAISTILEPTGAYTPTDTGGDIHAPLLRAGKDPESQPIHETGRIARDLSHVDGRPHFRLRRRGHEGHHGHHRPHRKNLGSTRASHPRASRHEKRQYRHFRNRCATDCHAEVTGRHIAHPAAHTADLRQLRT